MYVGAVDSAPAFIPTLRHTVICKLMNRPTVPSDTVAQMLSTVGTDPPARNKVGMQLSCC